MTFSLRDVLYTFLQSFCSYCVEHHISSGSEFTIVR